jgi:hypothetical protein
MLLGKGIASGFQNTFIAVDLQLQDFANITHGLRTLTASLPQRDLPSSPNNDATATETIAKGCTLLGG